MTRAAIAFLLLAAAVPATAQEAGARIVLERTACFGACPVYSVAVQGDGSVDYVGREHVRLQGARSWRIAPSAAAALVRELERADFFAMKDQYSAPVTDLPSTYVTLTVNGRSKRVRDHFGAPPELKRLESRIDAVSGARGCVWIDAAAIRDKQRTGWRATDAEAARWISQAASDGDAEVVKALLAAGASARAADRFGVTLVMNAAASGDPETVRALLAAGGDPTARDHGGRNAADRARDGMTLPNPAFVTATGAPKDYPLVLKLLTDE